MQVKKTLSNGIRVIGEQNPTLRSVTVGFWVRTGQRNERENEAGISHFIEHMLFKGTEKRTAREISVQIDEIGGQMNAFTGKEYTCFYTKSMDTDIALVLDILTDMLRNPRLDPEDIRREQGVVVEEINMVEDTPEDQVHDLLSEAYFGAHPLALPILGTRDSVNAMDAAAIRAYMARRYTTENIVVALAGNFDFETDIALLEELTGDWCYRGEGDAFCPTPEPAPRHLTVAKKTEQLHICLGYPGVSQSSPLLYPMSVFNNLYGGGMSSRLFQEIREERGLAYSVYSYSTQYQDTGVFTVYGGMTLRQTEAVAEIMRTQSRDVLSGGLTREELTRSKNQLRGNYILGSESSSNRMMSIGRAYLMEGRVRTPEEVLAAIDGVTMEQVCQVAELVFSREPAISAIGPKKGVEEAVQAFEQAE